MVIVGCPGNAYLIIVSVIHYNNNIAFHSLFSYFSCFPLQCLWMIYHLNYGARI